MNINNSSLYALQVQSELKTNSNKKQILSDVKGFEKIITIEDAKKYLEKIWKITERVTKFQLGGNCVITTDEDQNGFEVCFEYNKKNVTYYYTK